MQEVLDMSEENLINTGSKFRETQPRGDGQCEESKEEKSNNLPPQRKYSQRTAEFMRDMEKRTLSLEAKLRKERACGQEARQFSDALSRIQGIEDAAKTAIRLFNKLMVTCKHFTDYPTSQDTKQGYKAALKDCEKLEQLIRENIINTPIAHQVKGYIISLQTQIKQLESRQAEESRRKKINEYRISWLEEKIKSLEEQNAELMGKISWRSPVLAESEVNVIRCCGVLQQQDYQLQQQKSKWRNYDYIGDEDAPNYSR